MSLDNAALDRPAEDGPDFSAMTDRELAEYNARTLHEIVKLANGIHSQVNPLIAKLSKNPLLGGIFR